MMGIPRALVLLILIDLSCSRFTGRHNRVKRSRNEFILHRCTASAELSKRHKNEGTLNRSFEEINQDTIHRLNTSAINRNISDFQLKDVDPLPQIEEVSSGVSDDYQAPKEIKNVNSERLLAKNIRSTPLKTVNIKAAQNMPPIYRRKSLLPEIEHKIPDKEKNFFQSVFVIKPAV